jgi:hypothetical protein
MDVATTSKKKHRSLVAAAIVSIHSIHHSDVTGLKQ